MAKNSQFKQFKIPVFRKINVESCNLVALSAYFLLPKTQPISEIFHNQKLFKTENLKLPN